MSAKRKSKGGFTSIAKDGIKIRDNKWEVVQLNQLSERIKNYSLAIEDLISSLTKFAINLIFTNYSEIIKEWFIKG